MKIVSISVPTPFYVGPVNCYLVAAVADDDDYFAGPARQQILDARLRDAASAERQQRLERAHAPRAPRR